MIRPAWLLLLSCVLLSVAQAPRRLEHASGAVPRERASGASGAASAARAAALERGGTTDDDPQHAFGPRLNRFPAVSAVRRVADGEVVRVGPLAVTARYTPGATTWMWRWRLDARVTEEQR